MPNNILYIKKYEIQPPKREVLFNFCGPNKCDLGDTSSPLVYWQIGKYMRILNFGLDKNNCELELPSGYYVTVE